MSLAEVYASPLFEPLHPWLRRLPGCPDVRAIAQLAEAEPVFLSNGQRVRFVPPQGDSMAYECRVWAHGEVETRPDNWHDFFNALIWFAFPETKRAVTSAHVAAMQPDGALRNRMRDFLTHFDECGIVVLSSHPELLELLRAFAWKTLFVERRAEVIAHMRFVVFGHATYEALLQPFRGLTAKAILHEVSDDWLIQPLAQQVSAVDHLLASDLLSGRYIHPRDLQPLPLLGIPGVTPDNQDPAYYDDTWQFRAGRRVRPNA